MPFRTFVTEGGFVLSTESLRMSDSYESFIHESDITNHLTTEV